MNLGHAIKMCRSRRGLSKTELAKRASCSISYLSLLEKSDRDPSLSTVEKIAHALNLPVGVLFFLAADHGELSGIDKALADQLKGAALDLLSREDEPTLL